MFSSTIRVQVVGSVVEYDQDIAGYGEHIADGGRTVSLEMARAEARAFFRTHRDRIWKAVTFWVTLDDSGLAYRVDITRGGSHRILAAAPLPGPGNVRDLYEA